MKSSECCRATSSKRRVRSKRKVVLGTAESIVVNDVGITKVRTRVCMDQTETRQVRELCGTVMEVDAIRSLRVMWNWIMSRLLCYKLRVFLKMYSRPLELLYVKTKNITLSSWSRMCMTAIGGLRACEKLAADARCVGNWRGIWCWRSWTLKKKYATLNWLI